MNERLIKWQTAFVELWKTRDVLSLRNIRPKYLAYSLALPLAFILVNMQNNYLASGVELFGLSSLTLMYMVYSLGMISFMAISYNFSDKLAKAASLLSFVAMIISFIVGKGILAFVVLLVSWFGVGICAGYALTIYVYATNNTEKLVTICIAALGHGIFMCLEGMGIDNIFLSVVLPLGLMSGLVLCLFMVNKAELDASDNVNGDHRFTGVRLFFVFFFFISVIDSASSFVFTYGGLDYLSTNGIGIFVAVGLAIVIQLIFQQSVWHMWNLFFLAAVAAHILVLIPSHNFQVAANFVHGVIYIGYVSIFYTMGGINKRHNSIVGFKRRFLQVFCLLLPIFGVLGWVQSNWPAEVALATMVAAGILMSLFFLLSPLFQRYFFAREWIGEYQKVDMSQAGLHLQELEDSGQPIPGDLFDDFIERTASLTKTERELFRCYFDGKDTQAILDTMFISYNTLKKHNVHIFRKLCIRSRDELLLYIDLIIKADKGKEIQFL